MLGIRTQAQIDRWSTVDSRLRSPESYRVENIGGILSSPKAPRLWQTENLPSRRLDSTI
ncbi:hypothetical protein C2845_PM12G07060 [Panicum miliaceum]|uniref:Uncharacterized protein n=1 Tax=Panicum miliaceum TaxID=4540 RepID=A0A3L6QG39_PANMI|nr:hypothetical protein C2845_PM12G07060 [Panicum miliaceum]